MSRPTLSNILVEWLTDRGIQTEVSYQDWTPIAIIRLKQRPPNVAFDRFVLVVNDETPWVTLHKRAGDYGDKLNYASPTFFDELEKILIGGLMNAEAFMLMLRNANAEHFGHGGYEGELLRDNDTFTTDCGHCGAAYAITFKVVNLEPLQISQLNGRGEWDAPETFGSLQELKQTIEDRMAGL